MVALPGVTTSEGASCATIRDTTGLSSWTSSFANIQCYDALKVKALLNQIAGKTHNGAPAQDAGSLRHELPGGVHRTKS